MIRLTLLIALIAGPHAAYAQAPTSSFLWKLADQTLARPAALAEGTTASFWNPALASTPARTSVGAQLVRAPDMVGVDGFLGAVSHRLGDAVTVGVVVGRLDMRDIVRTTSSPISTFGNIPIFDQFAGLLLATRAGPLAFGATVRAHNSRFDVEEENGATTDVGLVFTPGPRLSIGGSTHLQSTGLERDQATEYLGAVEFDLAKLSLGGDSVDVSVFYGISSAANGRVDHLGGTDIRIAGLINVIVSVVREEGFGSASYRPTVELTMGLGRYVVGLARSEGLNGIGASYRVLFDLNIEQ